MKLLVRLCGLYLLLAVLLPHSEGQVLSGPIVRIDIKHLGPVSVSDDLIRANIRVKVGDPYRRLAIDDDIRNLYGTGLFYNIRVTEDRAPDGVVLTYTVQSKPRLTEIRFQGNKKFSDTKLRK